jgi:shikimate dehydrogenase
VAARCAVFGDPVAHSLSPRIHAAFAAATGIAVEYRTIHADAAGFPAALAAFAAGGGIGANVTLPHKQAALALASSASVRARRAGAANVLLRGTTGWHADNTDGDGLVRDLVARHGVVLRGRRTLLLGAGGAARGVAPALLDAGIGGLVACNRTGSRAAELVAALHAGVAQVRAAASGGDAPRADARDGHDLPDTGWTTPAELADAGAFDLVVNATAATRGGALPALPDGLLAPGAVAVDLNYGAAAVPFLDWARARGAVAVDGLGMLVEQAALSFALWHGVEPDTTPVLAMLRDG